MGGQRIDRRSWLLAFTPLGFLRLSPRCLKAVMTLKKPGLPSQSTPGRTCTTGR